MVKNIRSLGTKEKRMLALCAMAVCVVDFFYIHWISYEIAAYHYDTELLLPLYLSVLCAASFVAVKVMERKQKKIFAVKYLFAILFVGSIFAAVFCGSCPACSEVHDPVYKFLFRLFYGKEYGFA